MIKIKSDNLNFGICLPNNINEITKEHFDFITKDIYLSKHYCIIAICFNTTIFNFCSAINSNTSSTLSVTPLLAKINDEDAEELNAQIGNKVIIDRSSLERGIHLYINSSITSNVIKKYFNDSPELYKQIISNKCPSIEKNNKNIIVVEFKICPVNDIVATIPRNITISDPFVFTEDN